MSGSSAGADADKSMFSWKSDRRLEINDQLTPVLLRQVQELTGIAFVYIDLENKQRSVGPGYEKVHGFPPPASLRDMLAFVHSDDHAAYVGLSARMRGSTGRHSAAYRVLAPGGETRWIEAIAETTDEGTGRPTSVLLSFRNASGNRLWATDPSQSIELLQRVQSSSKVGVWETDLVTGKENWSPEAWDLVEPGGVGEATSERWLAAVHPDDRERALEGYCTALETGNYDDEFRIVHPDGSVHWHRAIAKVEFDNSGKPVLMRGMVVDVTERRQAKETLGRLAGIIESSPDFVGWADLEGRAVYLNPAGRSMIAVERDEEIIGRSIIDFVAPQHREIITGSMRESLMRDGMWSGEIEMVDRAGRIFPVSKVVLLHRDEAGQPQYMSTISRDITREKAAEAALREADRRKDEFLATLAHELRNPLAPLQSAADVMRQIEVGDARISALRRIVEQQTSHLKRLVDDLLDVSRLASGKLALQKAPTSLADAVSGAIEMCRGDTAARRHVLELVLPADGAVLRVDGDMFRLTQVLANLIGNAAKYTPDAGRIRVEVRRDGVAAVIAVEDNGVGIAAEFLPKVFDAFEQAAEQRQRAAGGLGLGLMLVKQIVELHGGMVSAASDGPGRGSRFEVRLPLLEGGGDVSVPGSTGVDALSLKGIGVRVMVVDDYPAIRDSMELMLSMRGFVVATAESGEKALSLAQSFKPDAALLDVRMPGMSGHELAKALRAVPGGEQLRLIGMTGNGTEEDRRMALATGFDELVVKPVPVDKLTELLAVGHEGIRAVA